VKLVSSVFDRVPKVLGGLLVVLVAAEQRIAICHDADDSGGYFLFGCDDDWNTETDSWHETLEHALRQVEFEFPGAKLIEPAPDEKTGEDNAIRSRF
jgi:hypothetical protein